jgi:aspartyl-tRNA(Asn)/glutamyl-tRNA(Gln) amidotransferase subunit C
MKISREDVLHVAELARLELSAAEVETFQRQLDSILTYMGKLNELDTSAVEPMAQVLSVVSAARETPRETSALRDDLPAPCRVAEEVLSGAPDPSPPYFRVPKVIER